MPRWLEGRPGSAGPGWAAVAAMAAVAALVLGGLAWVTSAALELEQAQADAAARAERADTVRLALWRLDGLMFPDLSREAGRPFHHYTAVYSPTTAVRRDGTRWPAGAVLQPSPLLSADLPDWMALHFQTDLDATWTSPQVLSKALVACVAPNPTPEETCNVTPARDAALASLASKETAAALAARLPAVEGRTGDGETAWPNPAGPGPAYPPAQNVELPSQTAGNDAQQNEAQQIPEQQLAQSPVQQQARGPEDGRGYVGRRGVFNNSVQQAQKASSLPPEAAANALSNGAHWFAAPAAKGKAGGAAPVAVPVALGPMSAVWLPRRDGDADERLVLARRVRLGDRAICQGVLLDWPRLRERLSAEVRDLLPGAVLRPMTEPVPPAPERTMTALPVELVPGPATAAPVAGWTPLRIGLASAWAAAAVALTAVGLGGWSLIDLSRRRVGFVSAVTHELRTPLTTLRLYLDMLTGGLVADEARRAEYLDTLHAETERLNRLVANVLDFARLESARPRLELSSAAAADLLERARGEWSAHCTRNGKELIVEVDASAAAAAVTTDAELVNRVLGNLIDNACKYSRGAADPRVRLRAERVGDRLALSVEDYGPGIPARECRSVFRAFFRGRDADPTAGGVGLGLALADRWAGLLGGCLTLRPAKPSAPDGAKGACFRLELPVKG